MGRFSDFLNKIPFVRSTTVKQEETQTNNVDKQYTKLRNCLSMVFPRKLSRRLIR